MKTKVTPDPRLTLQGLRNYVKNVFLALFQPMWKILGGKSRDWSSWYRFLCYKNYKLDQRKVDSQDVF